MAIGQSPNPTVQRSTPQLATRSGKIVIDDRGRTSVSKVFAGGDVVRGGSTVILAMRDGRAAAEAIDDALGEQRNKLVSHPARAPQLARSRWRTAATAS